jgi:hypothetical protein
LNLQVTEALLWKLRVLNPETFCADVTLCEVVQRQASTRRLCEKCNAIEKIFIPINITCGQPLDTAGINLQVTKD